MQMMENASGRRRARVRWREYTRAACSHNLKGAGAMHTFVGVIVEHSEPEGLDVLLNKVERQLEPHDDRTMFPGA